MNFDVPYEDMVGGAQSGSSFGRRLSSGRGSSTASSIFWFICASSSGSRIESPHASYVSYPCNSFWSFCASSSGSRIESFHASYVSYPCNRLRPIYASSSYGSRSSPPTPPTFPTPATSSGPFAAPPPRVAGASTVPEIEDDSNHRFTRPSDEVRSRSLWTATA
ncbi:hypothetical protein Taro_017492 [Colocasia esculenta]|uniref:Uncharacterized protein n=1 Tax=Colocasia esculenta TaxID=4460 RepID=A0A843UW85_COLES|nr:hypothetical protein [Colocasia esculenta]